MKTYRIGQGYDIHRLAENRKLVLAGVEIPFEKGLEGHSDADVVAHAVIDSLLGAAALPDIGIQFPDTDPVFKNADSMKLMEKVKEKIRQKGFSIGNVDVTIIAELPRLAPYIKEMKSNIARALEIAPENVSVKATTNEKLGAIGKGEGMAALAVSLLYK
ncbi:MAG: 2-C-methyl-D-erythritol 2,4-cyclodiphosphate synthase [Candidatus Zixiibacteriota bacterium]|nr:MAG: 2-C-methyl-D-erythritol 2,4-cyclodiphosphate synthase [candidate division Zixibacteria bacterium]